MNYLYQITNLINNKIYVGVHKTDNIDDGYMGSGKVIKSAIKKHGIENFRKDILEFFDTYDTALDKESEIVTDEFLLREDVYNLRRGGTGGFDYINKLPQTTAVRIANGKKFPKSLRIEMAKSHSSRTMSDTHKSGKLSYTYFGDPSRQHFSELSNTEEALAKKKETWKRTGRGRGEKNSQFGKCWITKDLENKKIYKEQLDFYLEAGWIKGRHMGC